VVVGDDEHALPDPCPADRRRERLRARERVSPLAFDREVGELVAEERCARNVRLEVQLLPRLPAVELVGAVDEPVLDQ
jgi:hypothetical protein